MKTKIKYIGFGLALVIFILSVSCTKRKQPIDKFILVGYIYNSIDSTPFKDTRFKFYSYKKNPLTGEEDLKEDFFYTDEEGYFNHTTSMIMGKIVWTSYFDGAYNGPPPFGNVQRENRDDVNRIYTYYYDTLYTTPYY